MRRDGSRVTGKDEQPSLERRRASRLKTSLLVHVTCHSTDGSSIIYMTGKSVDVSVGGMRLLLPHHDLNVGSRVQLSFTIAGTLVEVEGSVVYVDPVGGFGMGIRFENLSPVSAKAISTAGRFLSKD